MAETKENNRGRLNQAVGLVVSDKADKTISVQIFRQVKHKKYGKFIKRSSVFKAHDEENKAKVGDKVMIFESRALSKTKRWKLAQIIEASAE